MRFVLQVGIGSLILVSLASAGGCTKFDLLNATIPSCGYSRTTDLRYGTLPRQALDVYVPGDGGSDLPVVVFFYGGYWQYGSKSDYRFVAEALTSRGFIVALPDYRLYPTVTFPAFEQDGASAVRWVHDNIFRFGGDPNRIYLMGQSAGAHIAALLTLDGRYLKGVGLDRSAIRATALLSGPYDFVPRPEDAGLFGMKVGDTTVDPAIEPIRFVDGHEPPMLLLHGLGDDVVDPKNSAELAERIRQAGGQVRYITYPRLGHAGVVIAMAYPLRWLGPVLRDVTRFFREN